MGLDWKLTCQLTHVSVQKSKLSEMSIRDLPRLVSNSECRSLLIAFHNISQPGLQKFRNHAQLLGTLLAQLTSHISHAQHWLEHVTVPAQRAHRQVSPAACIQATQLCKVQVVKLPHVACQTWSCRTGAVDTASGTRCTDNANIYIYSKKERSTFQRQGVYPRSAG